LYLGIVVLEKHILISHILKDIINDLNKQNNTFHVTCIQIYNNNIYDIFNKNGQKLGNFLKMMI